MTPIEQVRPTQPGNWTRRPEERKRQRNGPERAPDKEPRDQDRPGGDRDDDPGHIVDELA
jgi:hypothetical protein